MALDPNIILGAKSPQFDLSQFSPMNTLASAMKLKQLQQEGDINALNLRERRGLQEFLSGGRETEAPNLSLPGTRTTLATRFGETGRKVATSLTGIDTAQAALLKAETDEKVRRNALSVSKTAQYRDLLTNVNDQRSALQWIQLQQQDPDLVDSPIAKVSIMDAARNIPADPEGFNRWKQQAALGISKFIELNKPVTFAQDTGETGRLMTRPGLGGEATVVPGSEFTKTMTPAQKREAEDSAKRLVLDARRLGLEDRRVAVLEANNRRDADPAFQQQMATARATGEAIAKGDVAAMQALPKVISRAEEGVRLIDELVGKRDSTTGELLKGSKPHPGFSTTVGATLLPGSRFIPGTDAASFMSRFDQIKGASFLEAFESLKSGGAITEKEGSKATDAINRMSIATTEKEFISAAMDLQNVMRKGVTNAQAKASRSGGGGGRAGGGAVDTSNPLLK
jgi:hypothetical protein